MSSTPTPLSTVAMMTTPQGDDRNDHRSKGDVPGGNPFQGVGAAYMMLGSMLVGLGLGYAIDQWLDSAPIGLIVTSILFIGVGMYHAVREAGK